MRLLQPRNTVREGGARPLTSVMGKAVVKTVQAIPRMVLCYEHAFQNGAWHASAHP